ncbi:MAG: SdrD B-like domain-containing protein [Caldilineaceae bacterium]
MMNQIKPQSIRRFSALGVVVFLGLLAIFWSPAAQAAPQSANALYGPEDPIGESTLGDFVWHDVDLDGVFDVGEVGINNVLVRLYLDDGDGIFEPGGDDQLLNSMLTGDNPNTVEIEQGWYTFDVDFGPTILHWVEIPASISGPGSRWKTMRSPPRTPLGRIPCWWWKANLWRTAQILILVLRARALRCKKRSIWATIAALAVRAASWRLAPTAPW